MDCIVSFRLSGHRRELFIRAGSTTEAALKVADRCPRATGLSARSLRPQAEAADLRALAARRGHHAGR